MLGKLLVTLIPPPWGMMARAALPLLALAGAFGVGWMKGGTSVRNAWDASLLEAERDAARRVEALRLVEHRVIYQYIDRVHVVHERARTITKEIPVYVTREADSRCVVPRGFVWVHDAAAANAVLPAAPAGADEAAPGVTLAGTAGVVTENYKQFHLVRAQCEALQEWARGVSAIK